MSGGGRGEVGVVGSAGTTCMYAPKPEPWRGRLPPSTQQKLAAWAEAFGAAVQPYRDLLQLHVWDRLGWKGLFSFSIPDKRRLEATSSLSKVSSRGYESRFETIEVRFEGH